MDNRNHDNRSFKGKTLMLDKGKALKMDKPKAWSHQCDLVRGVGRKIVIQTKSEVIEGINLAADQFSVKVKIADALDGSGRTIVIFKSDIRYFEVL